VNNIDGLGGKGVLCGVVGDDEMGQWIMNELSEKKIGTHGMFVERGDRPL